MIAARRSASPRCHLRAASPTLADADAMLEAMTSASTRGTRQHLGPWTRRSLLQKQVIVGYSLFPHKVASPGPPTEKIGQFLVDSLQILADGRIRCLTAVLQTGADS